MSVELDTDNTVQNVSADSQRTWGDAIKAAPYDATCLVGRTVKGGAKYAWKNPGKMCKGTLATCKGALATFYWANTAFATAVNWQFFLGGAVAGMAGRYLISKDAEFFARDNYVAHFMMGATMGTIGHMNSAAAVSAALSNPAIAYNPFAIMALGAIVGQSVDTLCHDAGSALSSGLQIQTKKITSKKELEDKLSAEKDKNSELTEENEELNNTMEEAQKKLAQQMEEAQKKLAQQHAYIQYMQRYIQYMQRRMGIPQQQQPQQMMTTQPQPATSRSSWFW